MNWILKALQSSSFLILMALTGCTTFHRDTFLAEHSLDEFMADRPEPATLLNERSQFQQWLRAEWNRPIGKYRIFWSNERPTVSMAEHGFMPDSKLIVIRLSTKLSAADQLVALCFEICNAQAFADIDELAAQAMNGSISREDYIQRKSRREFDTVLRARRVVCERLPLSMDEQRATNLYRHLMDAPDEFSAYQAWNSRIPNSNYARTLQYYGMEYDQLASRRKH